MNDFTLGHAVREPLVLQNAVQKEASPEPAEAKGAPLDQAAVAYLRHLGSSATLDDLWSGLPRAETGMDFTLLARGLARLGFELSHAAAVPLRKIETPCLVQVTGGNYVLAHEFDRAGQNIVLTLPNQGERALRRVNEFSSDYTGVVLRFTPHLESLAMRHIAKDTHRHWFWRHFAPLRGRILDVALSSAFANLLAVAVSLFSLQVYDRVIPNQNQATLWVLVGGAALALAMEFVLRIARARLIDNAGRDIEIAVNRDLYEKLVHMRLDQKPMQAASLVSTMREFASVKEFFAVSAVGVVTDLPFVAIFLIVIYAISGPLVFVVMLGALAMIIASVIFQYRIHALSRDMVGGASAALRVLTETAYGLETLRSHRFAPLFQRNWEEVSTLNAHHSSQHRRLSAGLSFFAASLQMVTYIAAITGGVYLYFEDALSVGGIIAVSILTSRTLAPIVQLSGVLSRWKNTTASLEALEMIANAKQEREPGRNYIRQSHFQGALQLRDIRTSYPRVEEVQLIVPNLAIAAGKQVAILGENGSGKSLLLRVLAGLYHPSAGNYVIDGLEARQIDPDDLRRAIGYLPQEPRLFKGTLRENLTMGSNDVSDARLLEALEFAGLDKLISTNARGLDLEIQDGGEGLSVGQRAAVGLARIYLADPPIVLMDEPTAAMDSRAELAFVARCKPWLANRTAIICTHRMAMMEIIDEVVVIADGRMVAHGPKEATLQQFTRTAQSAPQSGARQRTT